MISSQDSPDRFVGFGPGSSGVWHVIEEVRNGYGIIRCAVGGSIPLDQVRAQIPPYRPSKPNVDPLCGWCIRRRVEAEIARSAQADRDRR